LNGKIYLVDGKFLGLGKPTHRKEVLNMPLGGHW